jgi:thiol-disulfide isomerase/thioredoxin
MRNSNISNMKKVILFLIPVLLLAISCRTKKPLAESIQVPLQSQAPSVDYLKFTDQTTWLLGYFKREQLYRAPHCEWYLTGYDKYSPADSVVNKLTALGTDNISIKIVMGTWCPDSRREVPRFIHILDLWKFPPERVTFIGVDDAKIAPVGEYPGLGIQRVPTFIIYKNNVETGRIIENPVTSLEQDIVNILGRNEK